MFAARIRVAAGLAAAACGAVAMLGCERPMGVEPVHGLLYVHFKAPMIFRPEGLDSVEQLANTPLVPEVVSKSVEVPANLKVGTATVTRLALPKTQGIASAAWGDVSLLTAAANAGITKVHYADWEYLSILGVYSRATVYVYGE